MYFGILTSVGLAEQPGEFWETLRMAVVLTLPFVLVSAVVAYHRERLWRSEWPLVRTLSVQAAVGVAFATTAVGLTTAFSLLAGMDTDVAEAGPWLSVVYRMISATFVYLLFLGCLMWAESVRRVRASDRAVARAAVLRAEAEAKAIRAQFNPHFVFNTLHSLMLLVRADPVGAERAIEDVATLIRYASIIQRRDIDAVPLSKELEVVRRYVALEQLRLQDRLRVEWVVDVDPATVTVPAFALQTLVENAIKHGLEPRPEGGRVQVELTTAEGTMTLRVSDDGVGAEEPSHGPPPGHGLSLLGRRLASRYGERGRLERTTAPGAGFTATVTLPVERPARVAELDVIEARSSVSSAT